MKQTTSNPRSSSSLQSSKKVNGETPAKITLNGSSIERVRSGKSWRIVRVTDRKRTLEVIAMSNFIPSEMKSQTGETISQIK